MKKLAQTMAGLGVVLSVSCDGGKKDIEVVEVLSPEVSQVNLEVNRAILSAGELVNKAINTSEKSLENDMLLFEKPSGNQSDELRKDSSNCKDGQYEIIRGDKKDLGDCIEF